MPPRRSWCHDPRSSDRRWSRLELVPTGVRVLARTAWRLTLEPRRGNWIWIQLDTVTAVLVRAFAASGAAPTPC
jgi:hypothetical protein